MRRRLAVSMCVIGFALPALARHGTQQAVNHDLDGWAVAPFTLTDQHGRAFTEAHLRGRWTFVLFGDTSDCATQCGAALEALAALCQRIERADAMKTTQVVFISLDPKRDTSARLRQYLSAYDTRFIGTTGTPEALRRLADDMRAGTAAASTGTGTGTGTDGATQHNHGSLLLIGPDATIRAEYLPPLDVLRLTASYMRMRRGSL